MVWCFDYWEGKMETLLSSEKSAHCCGTRVVWGGWSAVAVWIECFGFGSREDVIGWSVTGRWSRGNELMLTSCEVSVTRRDDVMMFVRGEAAPRRRKWGYNVSCADANFTGPKNKENSRGRFCCYHWTVKIWNNNELIYFVENICMWYIALSILSRRIQRWKLNFK
jgi:hypothetical protein